MFRSSYTYTAISIGTQNEIEIDHTPALWWRLLGAQRKRTIYRSGGASWYEFPSGKPATNDMQIMLNDLWAQRSAKKSKG